MNLWRSIAGMMEVELTSAAPENSLVEISRMGIELYAVQYISELSCRFQVSRRDYPALNLLAKKRGERLRILSHKGLYWQGKALVRRPVYLTGLCMLLILTLFLPSRILFVEVSGNSRVPSRQILAAAEEAGVSFWAERSSIRSERVKNFLLSQIPELQWVGVNTAGCLAKISVRERETSQTTQPQYQASRIVAARDGFVVSGTVTQGEALFQIGQTVKKGQVLISGYVDCGGCIRVGRSVGEVFAQTHRDLQVQTPAHCMKITREGRPRYKISVRIGKKRINLWKDSGIYPPTCGRMYQEYCLKLPGDFALPAALCVERIIPYETEESAISRKQAQTALMLFADTYLPSQMAAGEIQQKSQKITLSSGAYSLRGQYTCIEMIGREQPEQIGVPDGKNS